MTPDGTLKGHALESWELKRREPEQYTTWTGMSCPSWQWHRNGSSWSPVRTLLLAPLWCDLGFFPNSRGNKAAANLHTIQHGWLPQAIWDIKPKFVSAPSLHWRLTQIDRRHSFDSSANELHLPRETQIYSSDLYHTSPSLSASPIPRVQSRLHNEESDALRSVHCHQRRAGAAVIQASIPPPNTASSAEHWEQAPQWCTAPRPPSLAALSQGAGRQTQRSGTQA